MAKYHHFSFEEREKTTVFQREGRSQRFIAKMLNRNPASISREIRRNKTGHDIYITEIAERRSKKRRHIDSPRVLHHPKTAAAKKYIIEKLRLSWTPDEISGRMRLDKEPFYACPETIYKFIYAKENKHLELFRCLKRRQKTRYYRHSKRAAETRIAPGASVHDRSKAIDNRRIFGHLEADLVICKNGNFTTLIERRTRMVFLMKNTIKNSNLVINDINRVLATLPPALRRSITVDQGTEFAFYQRIEAKFGLKVYFCDPHSPWQKGANENFNGRLRHFFPKKADISTLSQSDLDRIAAQINTTPRKCLGYKTPNEAFSAALRGRCTSS